MIPFYSKLISFLRKNPLAVNPLWEMVEEPSKPYVLISRMDIQGTGLRERVNYFIWLGEKKDAVTGFSNEIYAGTKAQRASGILVEMVKQGFFETHQISELITEYAFPGEFEGDQLSVQVLTRTEVSNWLKTLESRKSRKGIFKLFRRG